jgi:hypothetical protein
MKTIVVDVDGIINSSPVQGQMTVQYFDASNWVITSIGIDLFHDHNNSPTNIHGFVKDITNSFEAKIEEAIRNNENEQ